MKNILVMYVLVRDSFSFSIESVSIDDATKAVMTLSYENLLTILKLCDKNEVQQ